MSGKIATTETAIGRPLRTLVPLIKNEIEQGNNAGIEHYRRAGEMLLEAKEQVERGEWTSWLDMNFHLSTRAAQRYMQLAELQARRARRFPTVAAAIGQNHEPARSWQAPVRQIAASVNTHRLAEERENRQREAALLHELAGKLVDIGYRVLAAKLHPDKPGGSTEAMRRLNQVRKLLKEAV